MNKLILLLLILLTSACSNTKDSPIPDNSNNTPIVTSEATYTVTEIDGLVYAEGLSHNTWNSSTTSTMSLELDVYIPNNAPENRPAIVLIHGGGFNGGSRKQGNIVNIARHFAERGWVAFSIDYRVKGDMGTIPNEWTQFALNNSSLASFDDIVKLYPATRDAKAAIRWVYTNADTYNINTDYITVGGGSAGCFLSIALGTTEAEDYTNELTIVEDPTLSTTNLGQPTKVHTIIDFWGGDILVTLSDSIYGLKRFDSDDSPILIVHGDNDATVDFSNAESLRATYQSTGVDYEFHRLTGEGHAAWNVMVNSMTLSELARDFVVRKQNLIVE